ncbi:unnamed protein product [Owenia fusiformis]|uniref:C2H2-type domain-containing protein n=1 Tax=Owenia fusiformis TaxID=6347 RepID=A0A8S4NB46_OWEFU|nr:unnamed protein product [Owenia fusiformis]
MIRVHISENQQTGEQTKMFRCVLCLRDFVDRSNIRQHVRIHTGEKPYTCVLCNQAFTQSSNLKRHVNLRHLGLKENKSKLGKAEQLLYTNKFQGDLSQMVSQAVSSVQSENLSTACSDNLNQSSIPYQNQSDIENMYPPSSQDLVQYKPDSEGDKYQLPPEDSVPSNPENSVKYEPNPDNLDKYQSTPDDSVHSNSETTVKCEPNLENSVNSQPNPESSVKYEPNSEDSVEYQQNPESSGKYQTNPGDLVEDHVNFEDPNSYANSTVSKAYLSNPEDTNTKE